MRLIDLGLVYLVVGVGCAWALRQRRAGANPVADTVLTFALWPLYVPVLLGGANEPRSAAPKRPVSPTIMRERSLLLDALDAARARLDPARFATLLPTPAQIESLVAHLARLDARVSELDEVLAHEDFDPARHESKLRERDRAEVERATAAAEGARRLQAMRAKAARERDEMLGLCARLRMQVTVLRFADAAPDDDLAEVVREVMARVEGVGAALDPAVASRV